jgi:hypothetical protein
MAAGNKDEAMTSYTRSTDPKNPCQKIRRSQIKTEPCEGTATRNRVALFTAIGSAVIFYRLGAIGRAVFLFETTDIQQSFSRATTYSVAIAS